MGITSPVNTLRFALARPLSVTRRTWDAPLGEVLARVQDFREEETAVAPEIAALEFYLLNHVVGLVRQRKDLDASLGGLEYVVNTYYRNVARTAVRMFSYLLLICNSEARHAVNHPSNFWQAMKETFSPDVAKYHEGLQEFDSNSDRAVVANYLLGYYPKIRVGAFIASLCWVFEQATWGSSFGGKKWAAVTRLLRRLVAGKLTPEQMIDQAFNLTHNTGPIFDKGMGLFDKSKSRLLEILDIQAAGQIPQLVWSESNTHTNAVRDLHSLCVERMGAEQLTGQVDWEAVLKATQDTDRMEGYKYKAVQALEAATKAKQVKQKVITGSTFGVPLTPAPGVKKVPRPTKKKFVMKGSKIDWDKVYTNETQGSDLWPSAEK